ASESAPSWVALQSVPSRASGTPRIVESQGGYSLDVRPPERILPGAPTAQAYPLRIPSTPGGSSYEDPPGNSYIQGLSIFRFPPASGRIDVSIADADLTFEPAGGEEHLLWQLPDKRWALKTDRGMTVAKHVPLAPLTSPLHRSYGFVGNTGKSDDGDYLIQRPNNGHLMYGGGRKLAPQSGIGFSDDSQIDEPAANYLRSELPHIMSLGEEEDCKLQITHQWTGILGFSRDGASWVGEVPGKENANLWICAGYTSHGMPQAALSAYAVTKMLLQTVFDGKALAEVHSSLIEAGDLPESFIISAERIARARELPQISEQQHKTHVEKLSALGGEHFSTVEELRQV
ncbi:hypothetical protein V500_03955, partial [Pseudogymnoascus sp. VKM F-4518 (FW-2643)]